MAEGRVAQSDRAAAVELRRCMPEVTPARALPSRRQSCFCLVSWLLSFMLGMFFFFSGAE